MADPRFYDNRGPFSLAALCAGAGVIIPAGVDGQALVYDVAGLTQAGPPHLSFFDGGHVRDEFAATKAGWCLVSASSSPKSAPQGMGLLACASVLHAFAAVARMFYPENGLAIGAQKRPVHATARLGEGVELAPGVVIGSGAEIGARTKIGANAVIGRGVTIGRDGEIGANAWIGFAHLGDGVLVLPGARIGAPGFGFASNGKGHAKVPQLGRVIIQDHVEIGANSTIDRGALGDTVIGEGTKIDNLVQIGHNTVVGRHCVLAGQTGLSGSVTLGDFVIAGGQVGMADHVTIGDRARLAGKTGAAFDLPGGQDYGGVPARPIREWFKEVTMLAKLARNPKQTSDE